MNGRNFVYILTNSNAVSDVVVGLSYKRKPRNPGFSREYFKANYFCISRSCIILHKFHNYRCHQLK